jgi:hypothetical protein
MNPNHWQKISEIFTAEDIMTPRDQLHSLKFHGGSEPNPSDDQPFDVIPVVQNDRIIGVLEKGTTHMQPLSDHWLISRDIGIPDLVYLFAKTRQKAFLVLHKQDMIGLVSPADLNKLPARVYIYNLIGGLELALMKLVESKFSNRKDSILHLLSEQRQEDLNNTARNLQEGNVDIDLLQHLYLSDLINIVIKEADLREQLDLVTRNQAENSLCGLNELRNQTMHLVKPLLARVPEDLDKLHQRINRAEQILEKLGDKVY